MGAGFCNFKAFVETEQKASDCLSFSQKLFAVAVEVFFEP